MARVGFGQNLHQSQRLSLAALPRMLQSIEVLQLPVAALDAFLRDAYESNEALSLEEAPLADAGPGRRGTREDAERHDQMLQNTAAPEGGLEVELERQLALLESDGTALAWLRFLVECLDPSGTLTTPDERLLELARERGLAGEEAALGEAIATLQSLEPRGVGARSPIEALLLQLDPEDPDYALLCALLEDFLDEVARNRLPSVARAMGLDLEHLERLLGTLRGLDLRPVDGVEAGAAPPIRPDVVVDAVGEGFEVRVEQSGLPSVSLDEGVRAVAKDRRTDTEVRRYLRGRIDQARWIVEAVEQRRETLLRVATLLFHHQRPFLESGPGHLTPLRMRRLAEELDLHVSTVSRAVADKWVQTPVGLFPLRYFFQGAGGATMSVARDDVREAVRAAIEAEDPAHPLSDEDVVAALGGRGIELARRTVAKYRKELGIPSSYRRRRFT